MQNSHAESATTPRMPDSSHKKFFNQSLRPKFNSGKLIKKSMLNEGKKIPDGDRDPDRYQNVIDFLTQGLTLQKIS